MKARRPVSVVLFVIACSLMGLFTFLDDWKRDLTTNFARLDDASTDPELRPFVLSMPVADAVARAEQWVSNSPLWDLVSQQETESGVLLHLTHRTKMMRFVDDIRVRLSETDSGTRVEAESQSRIGIGDLGQNPRNLRELRDGLLP